MMKTTEKSPTPKPPKTGTNVRDKFVAARQELCKALIERDEEVDMVLTALVAGEHPLLVGPPGTAKSLLLDSLMEWAGSRNGFSILLTKFTTPEEVFGPISVTGLKEDKYRRVTTGKMPEAEFVYMDEVFKASSAILNTTLRILNERVFDNGGSFKQCPLQMCVAASNEWPDGDNGGRELGALFDRFLFRKKVKPISPVGGRRALLKRALDNDECRAVFSNTITSQEIKDARDEAKSLPWKSEAKKALVEILSELNKEGIFPGDRRVYKSLNAVRSFAYLNGKDEVDTEDLEILKHVLWEDPAEQPEKCSKVVIKVANPTGMIITDKMVAAEDVVAKCRPVEAVPKLQAIQKELDRMRDPRAKKASKSVSLMIEDLFKQVISGGGVVESETLDD